MKPGQVTSHIPRQRRALSPDHAENIPEGACTPELELEAGGSPVGPAEIVAEFDLAGSWALPVPSFAQLHGEASRREGAVDRAREVDLEYDVRLDWVGEEELNGEVTDMRAESMIQVGEKDPGCPFCVACVVFIDGFYRNVSGQRRGRGRGGRGGGGAAHDGLSGVFAVVAVSVSVFPFAEAGRVAL